MLLESAVTLSLLALTSALPHTRQTTEIEWGPCAYNFTLARLPHECARLTVPLDYTNSSDERTIDLDLLRSRAINQPSKGSILFNPGGPGGSGVEQIAVGAEQFHTILGGEYDLIGFDPRGTGRTLTAMCNNTLEDIFQELARDRRKRDETGLTGLNLTMYGPEGLELIWDAMVATSDICAAEDGDIGSYLSTAFVARDMIQIVDALNEDGMLRYWGVSYGSILGATVAAMFPERVDRLLIDGVVNAHEWYTGDYLEGGTNTDDVYNGFVSHCISNPTLCPLAANYTTEESLKTAISDLISSLNLAPQSQETEYGNVTMIGETVKSFIFAQLYWPQLWSPLAQTLVQVFNGNFSSFATPPPDLTLWNPAEQTANMPIRCSEFGKRVESFDDLLPLAEKQVNVTAFALENYYVSWQCSTWQMRAKERYTGDFAVKTNHPIMVIGNSYDPVTPLASARNMSATFEGSGLLHQDSYGHVSFAQPSICTSKAIRAYFVEGVLPEEGAVCESDVKPFERTSWRQVYNGTLDAPTKRAAGYSPEDLQLLAAVGALGENMMKTRS